MDRQLMSTVEALRSESSWQEVMHAASRQRGEALVRRLLRAAAAEVRGFEPEVRRLTEGYLQTLPVSLSARLFASVTFHPSDSELVAVVKRYLPRRGARRKAEVEAELEAGRPAAKAVVEVWQRLFSAENPFAFLGAMYLREALLPKFLKVLRPDLAACGMPVVLLEMLDRRAMEERKHAAELRSVLEDMMEAYPQTADGVSRGYQSLLEVYPVPVWRALLATPGLTRGGDTRYTVEHGNHRSFRNARHERRGARLRGRMDSPARAPDSVD